MNKKQQGFFNGATEAICEEARKTVTSKEDQQQKERSLEILKELRRAFAQPLPEEVDPSIKPEQTTIN